MAGNNSQHLLALAGNPDHQDHKAAVDTLAQLFNDASVADLERLHDAGYLVVSSKAALIKLRRQEERLAILSMLTGRCGP